MRQVSQIALVVSVLLTSLQLLAQGKEPPMEHPTFYRTTLIDRLSIFCRDTFDRIAEISMKFGG